MSTQILDIITAYLHRVKVAGAEEVKACCPFHRKADGSEERDPSFYINIYNGLWYCHSCHVRGNLYTFLRDIGIPRDEIRVRYQDALEEAGKYAPPTPDPMDYTASAVSGPLPESFLGNFDYCPQALLNEGYSMETLRRFDIGFDFLHNRITFPLRDHTGQLVGISGRATQDGGGPRYKLYDNEYTAFGLSPRKTERRYLVWNIHNVINKLQRSDADTTPVVVVEGYKAAMSIAQAGHTDVVALSGSYLTQEQLWALQRLHCPLLFMLDNDKAGRTGQLDACSRISASTPPKHVLVVPYSGKQPSDLTAAEILAALQTPQLFSDWYLMVSGQITELEQQRRF